jgi:chitodextrinase
MITDSPASQDYPEYSETSTYKGGDIVLNEGKLYLCVPGVTEGWCDDAAWAYEPGQGTAWDQAWKEYSSSDNTDNQNPDDSDQPNQNDNSEENSQNSDSKYTITQAELDAKEADLTNTPVMSKVKESIRTRPNAVVEAVTIGNPSNPENVKRVESIISQDDWNYMFPRRSPEYTYRHFLQAVAKFPAFCGNYTDGRDADKICREALATMFAHFTQETGGHTAHWDVPEWRQGLVHVREMGWNETMRGGYNGECNPDVWQGQTWPCGKFANGDFKSYFGRGAKQLSYNYNYGPFSQAMFGDVRVLLDNPEMVADTWLNLASAVFFFVYPQPPKPSMLHVIDGTWQPNAHDKSNGLIPGFGVTTQIINGGVECGGSVEVQQSINRIGYYQNFSNYLKVNNPSNEIYGCKGMKQFDNQGAGATKIFWEQDYSYNANNPGGKSYACKLVGYQTPYSAFTPGDYTKCVKAHFPDIVIK